MCYARATEKIWLVSMSIIHYSLVLFMCVVGLLSTSMLLIGYYHGILLRDTSVDPLINDLCSTGLLTAQKLNVISSGHSLHHRNWLLLEHVRHMDSLALLEFSELVKNVWPQIGLQLITGIELCSYVAVWSVYI